MHIWFRRIRALSEGNEPIGDFGSQREPSLSTRHHEGFKAQGLIGDRLSQRVGASKAQQIRQVGAADQIAVLISQGLFKSAMELFAR